MRPFATATLSLAILLSPYALLSGDPMQTPTSPTQREDAPRVLRLDPQLDKLLAPDAVPTIVATGFHFTEGPMWRHGRLWFVDEEGDKVHAVTAEGEVSTLVDYQHGPYAKPLGTPSASKSGATTGPNAMAPAPDGSVVAMQQYARDVVRLHDDPSDPHAPVTQTPYFDSCQGKHLNSPNDVVFAPDGSFYFSDPNYGLALRDKDPAKQLPYQAVFHVVNGKPEPVITDLATPNGVALSPDGKTLYVNNSGPDQRVIAYTLQHGGRPGPPRNVLTFTGKEGPGVPDGLKVDSTGNLWTTGPGGIRIVTSSGHLLGQVLLPQVASNLAWGDADGQTLYICAHDHIYKLHTLVKGSLPVFQR